MSAAGTARAEEARERNRARAERLAEEFCSRSGLTADDVEDLARLAAGTPHAAEWRERLQRDHPDHPRVLLDRLFRARTEQRHEPARLLVSFDSLWAETEGRAVTSFLLDQVRGSLASEALTLALRNESPEEQALWARRYRETPLATVIRGPVTPSLLKAQRHLQAPPLRGEGIAMATGLLRHWQLGPDEERLLGETVSQQRTRTRWMVASLLTSLHRALLNWPADLILAHRWPLAKAMYDSVGADACFVVYPGIGHRITPEMFEDIKEFFRAHR